SGCTDDANQNCALFFVLAGEGAGPDHLRASLRPHNNRIASSRAFRRGLGAGSIAVRRSNRTVQGHGKTRPPRAVVVEKPSRIVQMRLPRAWEDKQVATFFLVQRIVLPPFPLQLDLTKAGLFGLHRA